MANTLEIVEQMSYLIFFRRLEVTDSDNERKAKAQGKNHKSIYNGHEKCRWSFFKNMNADDMFEHVSSVVFPFVKGLDGEKDTLYSQYLKDARLIIPVPSLLVEAVSILDDINISSHAHDVQGDIYEELLGELSQTGKNGQFRTPRHIIEMMVDIVNPQIGETVCDPACGTGGFLFNAYQYILRHYTSKENLKAGNLIGDKITEKKHWGILHNETYTGFDSETVMIRIAVLNMMLHGISQPNIHRANSLSKSFDQKKKYDIILANPPFSGAMNSSDVHDDLTRGAKKTELLFCELFYNILDVGGRAAVIVPAGVLFGVSNAHLKIRKLLLEQCNLHAIVYLPSGVFKPYSPVTTAILFFTKGGQTDKVWIYEMVHDGLSLDGKRIPEIKNDIPDVLKKFPKREKSDQSISITIDDIKENNYNLNVRLYIDNSVPEKEIDIQKTIVDLKKIEHDYKKLNKKTEANLKKLKFKM
jgi:type I restriction enzyme M protein